MTNFATAALFVIAFDIGAAVAWFSFDYFFYRPLHAKAKKILEKAELTSELSLLLIKALPTDVRGKKGEKLILSPLQVHPFGRPRRKEQEDGEDN